MAWPVAEDSQMIVTAGMALARQHAKGGAAEGVEAVVGASYDFVTRPRLAERRRTCDPTE
jgi:hypothetical protein